MVVEKMDEKEAHVRELQLGKAEGLVPIDFIPSCLKKRKFLEPPVYENFPTLVQRANEWLVSNPGLKLKTCETVEHFSNYGESDKVDASLYRLSGENFRNEFVRGLRLWLHQPRNPIDVTSGLNLPQQIGYFDSLPRVEPIDNIVVDRLDSVIQETNRTLQNQPLPGKIITIETDRLKIGTDTNATYWTETGSKTSLDFIYRIRIFYQVGPAAFEVVGLADFSPQVLTEGHGDPEQIKFEPFPQVLAKAHQWVASQPENFDLLNVQTLVYKSYATEVDTLKMTYSESNGEKMYFVRYLRLAYVVSNHASDPRFNLTSREPVKLNCKLFVPRLFQELKCCSDWVFETQKELQTRIAEWLLKTGAKLVSVETLPMRVFGGAEEHQGFHAMYTWNSTHLTNSKNSFSHTKKSDQYFLTLYRVYVDGVYPDPVNPSSGSSVEEYMLANPSCIIL